MTIKSYKDLCNEIEIWKERLRTYEVQIEAIRKLARLDGPSDIKTIDYTQPVRGTNISQIGFEEALDMLAKIQNHIYLHQRAIKDMEKFKKKIEDNIEKLEGIDKRVIYLRDIEGIGLADIAQKLNYSEIYIKKYRHEIKEYTDSILTRSYYHGSMILDNIVGKYSNN